MISDAILIPILALQTNKYNQLLVSNNKPSFFISVDGYEIYNNTIFYVCEIGISRNKNDVLIKSIKLRYSRLYDLYQYLLTHYGKVHKFKPFPPKNYYGMVRKNVPKSGYQF